MDKYQKAIFRYEKARLRCKELRFERSILISECSFGNGFSNCAVMAFEEMRKHNRMADHDEGYSFDDSFECLVNDYSGACESCAKARKIKIGPLAEANKELGIAKRQLSALAKGLMKNG